MNPVESAERRPGVGVLALVAAVLALVLLVFEWTDWDLRVQDWFFNFATQRWVVDAQAPLGRALFYDGPKLLVWMAGLTALALWVGPERWRRRGAWSRRGLGVAVLTIATVPALAGWGKATTNVFCPYEVQRYGGAQRYVKTFDSYPAGEKPKERGRGFPAGHASGGFALLGWAWARRSRRWRRGVVAAALGLGWWMGGYQMLKGAHYLSHTVTTMLLAVIVALLWSLILRPRAEIREDER